MTKIQIKAKAQNDLDLALNCVISDLIGNLDNIQDLSSTDYIYYSQTIHKYVKAMKERIGI